MPFIYDDDNLVNQLVQVGSELENKISKKGQVAPAEPVGESLRALLNNLRDQITPLKEAPEQVGHATGIADLASHNMDSMGDFVDWLAKHGTRIGGTIIVYPGNVERPGEDYGYFKIEPGTEIIVPLARPDRTVVAYWINPDALKQYLVSLQADPKLKTNVMFQVQLLKLVQDANRQLDVDIGEQYKEPEKVLPDTTQVDALPQILDPDHWGTRMGTVPLTLGDLKSVDTLKTWLRSKGISLKTAAGNVTPDDLQEFNLCAVINILNKRALGLGQGSQRPELRAYIVYVEQVASQANCALTDRPTAVTPGAPAAETAGVAALKGLATLRPFNSQYISFPEIKTFLEKYVSVYPDAKSTADNINAYIDDFRHKLALDTDTFQMYNLTTDQFKSWLKNPAEALVAAERLYDIVHYAGTLYQRLVNALQVVGRDPKQLDPGTLRGAMQQVTPGGPQMTNISALNQLKYLLSQRG